MIFFSFQLSILDCYWLEDCKYRWINIIIGYMKLFNESKIEEKKMDCKSKKIVLWNSQDKIKITPKN